MNPIPAPVGHDCIPFSDGVDSYYVFVDNTKNNLASDHEGEMLIARAILPGGVFDFCLEIPEGHLHLAVVTDPEQEARVRLGIHSANSFAGLPT